MLWSDGYSVGRPCPDLSTARANWRTPPLATALAKSTPVWLTSTSATYSRSELEDNLAYLVSCMQRLSADVCRLFDKLPDIEVKELGPELLAEAGITLMSCNMSQVSGM